MMGRGGFICGGVERNLIQSLKPGLARKARRLKEVSFNLARLANLWD